MKPTVLPPALTRAMFTVEIMPATIGADADVPPADTVPLGPPQTYNILVPMTATSGYPLPTE